MSKYTVKFVMSDPTTLVPLVAPQRHSARSMPTHMLDTGRSIYSTHTLLHKVCRWCRLVKMSKYTVKSHMSDPTTLAPLVAPRRHSARSMPTHMLDTGRSIYSTHTLLHKVCRWCRLVKMSKYTVK